MQRPGNLKNLKSQDSTEVSNQDIHNTVNTMFTTTSLCMHIKQRGAEIASTGKRKYGKRKYTCKIILIVEITMELPVPLLVE